MSNPKNYYQILHLQPDAPIEVIRTSYRALMQALRIHPDLGGDHEKAAIINEAFSVLNDPQLRAAYDKVLNGSPDDTPPRKLLALPGELASSPAQSRPDSQSAAWRSCAFCRKAHAVQIAELPDATCEYCRSPLFPAAQHESRGSTRRAMDRIPRRMRVVCTVGGQPGQYLEMYTVDVSISGMRLSSPHRLMPGQRLQIQCSFCQAVGLVTYVAVESEDVPGRWHIGVQFLTLKITQARGVFLSLEV